ncbi:TPA: hypothetical protein I7730_00350 [Vibrio vulnificus]|uniref:Uncharacterized protein n=1 Tax=Vibrio vulnificus TaxID=672 RepID=A0A8H9K530_VIBVL|nr:hypothetical protein [Vibrio vulnificus]HAS8538249.1 hypothetical protein [Vibrio vulnificus]
MEKQFFIPVFAVDEAKAAIKSLEKKAIKLGLEAPTLTILEEFSSTTLYTSIVCGDHEEIKSRRVRTQAVVLKGELPKLNGYKLLATIDHVRLENGDYSNDVTIATGQDTFSKEERNTFYSVKPYCGHCNTMRYRKTTYLLENKEGDRIQLGSTCVDDFISSKSLESLVYSTKLNQIVINLDEGGFDSSGLSANNPSMVVDIEYAIKAILGSLSETNDEFISRDTSKRARNLLLGALELDGSKKFFAKVSKESYEFANTIGDGLLITDEGCLVMVKDGKFTSHQDATHNNGNYPNFGIAEFDVVEEGEQFVLTAKDSMASYAYRAQSELQAPECEKINSIISEIQNRFDSSVEIQDLLSISYQAAIERKWVDLYDNGTMGALSKYISIVLNTMGKTYTSRNIKPLDVSLGNEKDKLTIVAEVYDMSDYSFTLSRGYYQEEIQKCAVRFITDEGALVSWEASKHAEELNLEIGKRYTFKGTVKDAVDPDLLKLGVTATRVKGMRKFTETPL